MLRMRNMARIAPDSPDPLAPALRKLIARLCHYRGAAVLQGTGAAIVAALALSCCRARIFAG